MTGPLRAALANNRVNHAYLSPGRAAPQPYVARYPARA